MTSKIISACCVTLVLIAMSLYSLAVLNLDKWLGMSPT